MLIDDGSDIKAISILQGHDIIVSDGNENFHYHPVSIPLCEQCKYSNNTQRTDLLADKQNISTRKARIHFATLVNVFS